MALAAWLLVLTPDAEAHSGPCERIRVDIRDRGELLNSYTVGDPEYVARKHDEIDRNGQDGVWTVAAGELGSLEYTVTYTCLARSGSD